MPYNPVKHLSPLHALDSTNTTSLAIGEISHHRILPVLVHSNFGLDGLDLAYGGDDDRYHIVNLATDKGYFDSIAVNGAYNDAHATALATEYCKLRSVNATAEVVGGFDCVWDGLTLQKFVSDDSQKVSYKPIITKERLTHIQQKITATPALWDGLTLKSHNGDVGALFYELVKYDGLNELLTPTSNADLPAILGEIAPLADTVGFDALVETNGKLEQLKNRLAKALQTASDNELSVSNFMMSAPFSKAGKANVYFEFELSDGQIMRIFFHNPDSTPNKLTATDVMVSWKWTLNNKDVTAVISPNQSESVSITTLAQNMMRIARQNSKRFVAGVARRNKVLNALNEATAQLSERQAYHTQVLADIDALREQIKNATQAIDDKAKGASKNTAENVNESGLPITVANEPTDELIVLAGTEFGQFDLSNNDDVKKFAQKVYQELDNLNGEFVFNKSLNANVKLNTTGLNKIRRYNGLDKSPVKLQAVAKLKEIVANAKLFKTDDSYDVGGQKGGLVYYYLKTPFIVDGVEYGARIVIRGDGNGNFYYDFQVKDNVSMILDGAFDTTENPLGRDISYDWKATSNGFDGYSTNLDNESQDEFDDEQDEFVLDDNQASLFDGLDEFGFDAARKRKMVLNLFIFDKDGNEIGDEIGNEADNKTPAETAQDQAKDVVMKVRNATLNNIIKKSVRIIVSDKDNWWSNGHIAIFENPNGIDFSTTDKTTRPDDSFDKYINPTNKTNFQIKRIAKYGTDSVVELTGNGVDDFNRPLPRHLFVSQRYLAFLYKYLGKTIELTASDVPNTPILVHKGGKLAGLIMPMMIPEIARIETTYAVNGDVDDDDPFKDYPRTYQAITDKDQPDKILGEVYGQYKTASSQHAQLWHLKSLADGAAKYESWRVFVDEHTKGELILGENTEQNLEMLKEHFNYQLSEHELLEEKIKQENQRLEQEYIAKLEPIKQAFADKTSVEIGRAIHQLEKQINTYELGNTNYKEWIEHLIDNQGCYPKQSEHINYRGDKKMVYRLADSNGKGYELNKTQYVYAEWYFEQKHSSDNEQENEPMNEPQNTEQPQAKETTGQAVAQILVNEYGWQYTNNQRTHIALGRYTNDKFGEFAVSADIKDDDIVANQPLTNVFIGGVRDVVQDAKDFHRRALDWLDSYKSQPVSDENKTNDEQDMNNPNYTQSDTDYLQSIINGTLDLETVDMDKMIEIGEKDEHDPMYEQALQIVSDYLDEMSK